MTIGFKETGMVTVATGVQFAQPQAAHFNNEIGLTSTAFYHGINVLYHTINQAVAAPKVRHALIRPRAVMGSCRQKVME